MPTRQTSSYKVPAASGVSRILLLLSQHQSGLRMIEIARPLDMNVSTCHNMLRTLRDEGLVSFDDQRKLYRIGLALVAAISNVIARGDQLSLIRPIMQSLSDRLRMTAILGELVERRAIRLLMNTAPAAGLSLHPPGLDAVPILSGSMGRVAAAWTQMGEAEMRDRFDEASREPELRFEDFLQDVQDARDRGWAVDDGTWQRGIWGIAAPILSTTGKVNKILCLASAVDKLPPERVQAVAAELLLTVKAVSGNFAHVATSAADPEL